MAHSIHTCRNNVECTRSRLCGEWWVSADDGAHMGVHVACVCVGSWMGCVFFVGRCRSGHTSAAKKQCALLLVRLYCACVDAHYKVQISVNGELVALVATLVTVWCAPDFAYTAARHICAGLGDHVLHMSHGV